MIWIDLIYNLALLIALSVISGFVDVRWNRNARLRALLHGVVFGGVATIGMLRPFVFAPGLIFDGRSVMISLGGLFFGPWTAALTCLMTIPVRAVQGGPGTVMGVLVILASAVIGVCFHWHLNRKSKEISSGILLLFGIIVHLAMLAMTAALPPDMILPVLKRIGWPVMLIYPLATVLIGKILSDQAARNRLLQTLQESEGRYKSILSASPDDITITDLEGRILMLSPKSLTMFGGTEEESIGRLITDFLAPEDRDRAMSSMALMFQGVMPGPDEYRGLRMDGSVFDIEANAELIRDADRRPTGIVIVVRDITERKRTEKSLLRLSAAINQTVESVVVTDTQGIIQYVNPAFETITGYSSVEIAGQNPHILKSGQHDEAFYADLWKTIATGKTWEGRFTNKRKNGTLYTEEASISPVRDSAGIITGYVAVSRDITEELQKDERFRQSQKMEAVGQLAGGIAHDFNNVLQAVLGFSEILLNRLPKESSEHRNVIEIQKAAQRAAEMTRQLLAFSRKQPVEMKRINLNIIIQDAEVLLRLLLGDKIKYGFNLSSGLCDIRADNGQMTQILMNLAVNSRDAMPEGGRLTIATENVTVPDTALMPEAAPGSYVCLSVTDTGCGMTPEVKDHLFEPFFTTKEVGKGTGLGLAVVYGVVKQNKGWIHLHSEEGLGTVLKIYLPALEKPSTSAGKSAVTEQKYHERILLVEDDEDTLNMVVRILSNSGYETVPARNAEEAAGLFEQENGCFDLLFSDIILPGKTGLELANALRIKNPGLPVLLYSGYRDQRERWNFLESKGYFFLQKPFSLTGLLAAVHEALEERRRDGTYSCDG